MIIVKKKKIMLDGQGIGLSKGLKEVRGRKKNRNTVFNKNDEFSGNYPKKFELKKKSIKDKNEITAESRYIGESEQNRLFILCGVTLVLVSIFLFFLVFIN